MDASQAPQAQPPQPPYAYCDVVMKGGITSGIIYPKAVVELATRFRFKNIGGTSAGAIAAAVAAAAEYGRRTGHADAFDIVAKLPDNLAENGHLLALFTPDPGTRKVFRIGLGLVGPQNKISKTLKTFGAILLTSPLWSLLVLVFSLLLAFAPCMLAHCGAGESVFALSGLEWTLCSLCALILSAILSLIVAGLSGVFKAANVLAGNGFGMCSGLASASTPEDSLTGWMHTQIQAAAGRPTGPALTFGDLWHAPKYPGETLTTEHTVTLKTVTTNVTQGRPYSMPFEQKIWLYDEADMRRVLPGPVVDQMIAATQPSAELHLPVSSPLDENKLLLRLPDPEDLPILLATRMSLSFPVLLSAVPLYIVDRSIERNQVHTRAELLASKYKTLVGSKTWFSDGGICSNFPINFFDSPVPRWPTFGITLQPAGTDAQTTDANLVSISQPNREATSMWNNLGDPAWTPSGLNGSRDASDRLGRFGHAIINTMQNWRDNLQATSPGFRERIVTVKLRPDEGGLNLNMSKDLIDKLGDRGALAGQKLNTEFQFAPHMFIRFRTMLAALQQYLHDFNRTMTEPVLPQDDDGLKSILAQRKPEYYDWPTDVLRKQSLQAALDLQAFVAAYKPVSPRKDDFSKDAPRPLSHLHNTPDF